MAEFLDLDQLRKAEESNKGLGNQMIDQSDAAASVILPTFDSVKKGFLMLLSEEMTSLLMTNYDGKAADIKAYGIRLTQSLLEYREENGGPNVKKFTLNLNDETITFNDQPATDLESEQFYKKMKQVGNDMKNHKLFYFEEAKET